MSRLIWSPAALVDVKRLYDFLKPKNLDAAKRAAEAIRQGVNVLKVQPGVGRPVEEMDDEFRDWLIDKVYSEPEKLPFNPLASKAGFGFLVIS